MPIQEIIQFIVLMEISQKIKLIYKTCNYKFQFIINYKKRRIFKFFAFYIPYGKYAFMGRVLFYI